MKNLLLFIFLCVQFSSFSFAQDNSAKSLSLLTKQSVVGIWELKTITSDANEPQKIPVGFVKILNSDQTFYNLRATPDGFVVSHGGTYEVISDKEIKETVTSKSSFMNFGGLDLTKPLSYNYSKEENTFTIKHVLTKPDGTTMTSTEIWKRIDILP